VLGPERPDPILPSVLAQQGIRGPVALVSAGWRYDEDRDEPLRAAVGMTVHNLRLYHAYQDIEREAPDLVAAHARKQVELKRSKEAYRVAISQTLGTLRKLWPGRRETDRVWFDEAVAHLQKLDTLFLAECDRLHAAFHAEVRPDRHPLVRTVYTRVAEVLAGCEALLVAGGHVGILRNRIAFFGIEALLPSRPVIAWSGGAMVLSERVLLYHDHTTFGVGTAEMLDRGFGLVRDVVFLPHARQRLALDDPSSVGILARRLAPALAIGLENGAWLDGRVSRGVADAVRLLRTDGTVTAFEVT
jgi:hypothetical protein